MIKLREYIALVIHKEVLSRTLYLKYQGKYYGLCNIDVPSKITQSIVILFFKGLLCMTWIMLDSLRTWIMLDSLRTVTESDLKFWCGTVNNLKCS
jgi:hypothetical protein